METTLLLLRYGRTESRLEVKSDSLIGVVGPRDYRETECEDIILRRALENPNGAPRLMDLARPGQRIAIVVPDLTRRCPSDRILPLVLEELGQDCISPEDLVIVAALGLHRPMTALELRSAVGASIPGATRVINHDPEDIVRVGVTKAGTVVELFRPLVEANLRICLGNLEAHYFAGFTGGYKAIVPGCASPRTIVANHSLMTLPMATAGRIEGNPVRADLEEAARLLGESYIVNVTLGARYQVVDAVAGDPIVAHRIGCERLVQRNGIMVGELADLVLASAGGYPRDMNLYQAHKALQNASHFVREGGVIILLAECPEGFGHPVFFEWMTQAQSPDSNIERIRREFELGGHKAAAIAKILQRATVYLVSSLPPELVRASGLVPFRDPQDALGEALGQIGVAAKLTAIPDASSIVPVVA